MAKNAPITAETILYSLLLRWLDGYHTIFTTVEMARWLSSVSFKREVQVRIPPVFSTASNFFTAY